VHVAAPLPEMTLAMLLHKCSTSSLHRDSVILLSPTGVKTPSFCRFLPGLYCVRTHSITTSAVSDSIGSVAKRTCTNDKALGINQFHKIPRIIPELAEFSLQREFVVFPNAWVVRTASGRLPTVSTVFVILEILWGQNLWFYHTLNHSHPGWGQNFDYTTH
jgi:hypothetical protein